MRHLVTVDAMGLLARLFIICMITFPTRIHAELPTELGHVESNLCVNPVESDTCFIECLRDDECAPGFLCMDSDCGACSCQISFEHFQCLPNFPEDGCPYLCHNDDECAEGYICNPSSCGSCECLERPFCFTRDPFSCVGTCESDTECEDGLTCQEKECGACECREPPPPTPDCVDEPEVSEECQHECDYDSECDADHSCQNAPCGSCRCFLDTPDPPDCCYDEGSDCLDECRFHSDCPSGNQLCKPTPDCEGGCFCDSGEQPDCMEDAERPEGCESDCFEDTDCYEGLTCEKQECGSCRCSLLIERDCCPDLRREDSCEVGCADHEDCEGEEVCVRSDCGGCQCVQHQSPEWGCVANPKIEAECPDACQKDEDCGSVLGMCTFADGCCGCILNDG